MLARSLSILRLPTLLLVGFALVAVEAPRASASETSLCIQRFGVWAQLRDRTLKPLSGAPTLLGLDSAWCARSPADLADLRQKFAGIVASCQGLPQSDLARVGTLFTKTEQSLNRVSPCPVPQIADKTSDAWSTQVKPAPTKDEAAKTNDARRKEREVPAASKVSPPSAQTASAAPREAPVRLSPVATKPFKIMAAEDPPVQLAHANGAANSPRQAQPITAAPPPECLAVSRSAETTYVIENRSCPADSLLTAFEVSDGAAPRCFTKKIRNQISIGSSGSTPFIYFQCIEGAPGCTGESLSEMFPECSAG